MIRRLFFCLLVSGCFTVYAKELTVVAGWDKPPYVITENHSGFELELVDTILTRLGHTMNPVFVPFGRSARQLENGVADIVLTLTTGHQVSELLLSDVYVAYQNAAITLTQRGLNLKKCEDLRPYTILAFQTAHSVLGPDYHQAVSGHKGYIEIAAQHRQVKMLLLGSVDVAVMDRNIFTWLRAQLPTRFQKEVTFHNLFKRSEYRAAILNTELRQQFNTQLRLMREDGSYEKLVKKYQLSYSSPPTGKS